MKLRHERMLICKIYLASPQKTELPPEKKLNPGHYLKNLEHPDKNLKSLEYLNPMRNLKLLEKYQPPPSHQKKRKSQSTRKRKNITPRKSFNHPKIASTIMKKLQTPPLENSQFLKKP